MFFDVTTSKKVLGHDIEEAAAAVAGALGSRSAATPATRGPVTRGARASGLANEFRGGIDDLAQEVELEKISEEFRNEIGLEGADNIGNKIRDEIGHSMDPSGELREDYKNTKETIKEDLENFQDEIKDQNHSLNSEKQNGTALKKNFNKPSKDEA